METKTMRIIVVGRRDYVPSSFAPWMQRESYVFLYYLCDDPHVEGMWANSFTIPEADLSKFPYVPVPGDIALAEFGCAGRLLKFTKEGEVCGPVSV